MASKNKKLIRACLAGKQSAYKKLYDKYSAKMLSVSIRYARNREDAEDILQEGFTKIFDYLHQVKNPEALDGWIRRIIVNTALAFYRNSSGLYSVTNIEEAENEASADITAANNLETEDLLKIVQKLPPGCQNVFNMFVIEGYTHKEIAEMYGISEGTSKSQLSDARKILKREISRSMQINSKKPA